MNLREYGSLDILGSRNENSLLDTNLPERESRFLFWVAALSPDTTIISTYERVSSLFDCLDLAVGWHDSCTPHPTKLCFSSLQCTKFAGDNPYYLVLADNA